MDNGQWTTKREYCILVGVAILVTLVAFCHDFYLKADAAETSGDKITRLRLADAAVPDINGQWVGYTNVAAYAWHVGTDVPNRPDGGIDPVTGWAIPGWPNNPTTGKPIIKWPILAEYNGVPSVVWYWGRSFRTSNGSVWGKPARWAYIRQAEEVWNPLTKQLEVPGLVIPGTPSPPPTTPATSKGGVHMDDEAGQRYTDELKRSFTVNQINKFLEASPYDEPDTGAPAAPGLPTP